MSNYMPDTEEIRNMYASPSWVTAAQEAERFEEFDRWLDQVKAEAWDEGFRLGDGVGTYSRSHRDKFNPYRKQEEA